jgi:hypothetical protein
LSNQQLAAIALGTSLALIVAIYFAFSRRYGSYVNVLTPFMLLGVPSYYILEGFNLALLGYRGSVFAYVYIYATYAVGLLARAVGYLVVPARYVPAFIRLPSLRIAGLPYLLLAVAFALYAPILIAHSDLLSSPREIYEVTRIGYGIQSFLSTFIVYIGFIVLLFRRYRRLWTVLFAVPALGLLYLHGSKGQVFGFFLIWLYFVAFVQRRRFAMGRLISLCAVSTVAILSLFYVTEPASFREDLLESVVSYAAEYTRNAVLVIEDDTLEPQYGRLTLEGSYYGLIPRQFFPDKRKDFGPLWLASRYYPGRFQHEHGAPAFGLGLLYADFGVFAIFYYAVSELLSGMMLKMLAVRLEMRPDAGTFLLFLAFMDVALIPTGSGTSLVVYYLLAHITKWLAGTVSGSAPQAVRS